MPFAGLISKAVVGGLTAVTVGVSSVLIGSMPPPKSSRKVDFREETHEDAERLKKERISQETKHCKTLLSNNQSQKYKILVCVNSNHSDLKSSSHTSETWYLYETSKQTLREIHGLVINNIQAWKWNWWGVHWDWAFIPFSKADNELWKKHEWYPYTKSEDGFNTRLTYAEFSLTDSSGEFPIPYHKALEKEYGEKCKYYKVYDCNSFWLKKENLTVLSTLNNLEEICLVKKEQGEGQNVWEIQRDCPAKRK